MAALVLPNRPAPSSMTPRPISSRNEQRPASQGPVNRYMRPGTRWAWDITLPPQPYVDSLDWDDLLSEADTVIMNIYQPGLDTGAPASPLIDGANQIGRILNLKGLTPGYVFRKGQWVSFPVLGQLFAYKVRTLTTVAGDGRVALPLLTLLRLPPANNAVVDVAQTYTVSFNSETGSGPAAVWVQAFKAGAQNRDNLGRLDYASADWAVRRACPSFTLQPDEDGYRIVLQKNASAPYNGVKMIMANFGPARDWRDDASQRVLGASVTDQSLAIVDLENQQAIASWRKRADATGGKPTILELVSSSFGNYIALTAEQIYFGDNTVFDDATDQLITVTNGVRRVIAWGAAFGSGADVSQLTEWEGPDSVALNAMTRANATFFRANAAPYVGGSGLNAGVFSAQANLGTAVGTRTSAGQVTTATVNLTVTGHTGTLTYVWTQIGGNEEWTITTDNGASTAFRVNVATPGEQKRATFACRISDSGTGKTITVIVGGAAIYNV